MIGIGDIFAILLSVILFGAGLLDRNPGPSGEQWEGLLFLVLLCSISSGVWIQAHAGTNALEEADDVSYRRELAEAGVPTRRYVWVKLGIPLLVAGTPIAIAAILSTLALGLNEQTARLLPPSVKLWPMLVRTLLICIPSAISACGVLMMFAKRCEGVKFSTAGYRLGFSFLAFLLSVAMGMRIDIFLNVNRSMAASTLEVAVSMATILLVWWAWKRAVMAARL